METPYGDAPADFAEPDFANRHKCHDWKNHISDRVMAMWDTFNLAQRAAIAAQADDMASAEEWD